MDQPPQDLVKKKGKVLASLNLYPELLNHPDMQEDRLATLNQIGETLLGLFQKLFSNPEYYGDVFFIGGIEKWLSDLENIEIFEAVVQQLRTLEEIGSDQAEWHIRNFLNNVAKRVKSNGGQLSLQTNDKLGITEAEAVFKQMDKISAERIHIPENLNILLDQRFIISARELEIDMQKVLARPKVTEVSFLDQPRADFQKEIEMYDNDSEIDGVLLFILSNLTGDAMQYVINQMVNKLKRTTQTVVAVLERYRTSFESRVLRGEQISVYGSPIRDYELIINEILDLIKEQEKKNGEYLFGAVDLLRTKSPDGFVGITKMSQILLTTHRARYKSKIIALLK
ncbi:MAG: hypothetical protein ABI721_00245 [Candidatus Dojkabacteria bacterium]